MASARPTVDVQAALKRATESMLLLNGAVGNPPPAGVSITSTPAGPAVVAAPGGGQPILIVKEVIGTGGTYNTLFSPFTQFDIGGQTFSAPMSYFAKIASPPTVLSTWQKDVRNEVRKHFEGLVTIVRDEQKRLKAAVAASPSETEMKDAYTEFLSDLLVDLAKPSVITSITDAALQYFGMSGSSKTKVTLQDAYNVAFQDSLKAALEATTTIYDHQCNVSSAPAAGSAATAGGKAPAATGSAPAAATAGGKAPAATGSAPAAATAGGKAPAATGSAPAAATAGGKPPAGAGALPKPPAATVGMAPGGFKAAQAALGGLALRPPSAAILADAATAAATAASEAERRAKAGNLGAIAVLKKSADSGVPRAKAAMRTLLAGGAGVPDAVRDEAVRLAADQTYVGGARTRRRNRKNQKSRKSRK